MRSNYSFYFAVILLTGCASHPQSPPVTRTVKVDGSNIAEVAAAGYKVVDQNGTRLYCRKQLRTGSHARYETQCLTEAELTSLRDASRRSIEEITRRPPPPSGK